MCSNSKIAGAEKQNCERKKYATKCSVRNQTRNFSKSNKTESTHFSASDALKTTSKNWALINILFSPKTLHSNSGFVQNHSLTPQTPIACNNKKITEIFLKVFTIIFRGVVICKSFHLWIMSFVSSTKLYFNRIGALIRNGVF